MYKFCKNVMYFAGVAAWGIALFGCYFFARVPEVVGYVTQRIEYHINYAILFSVLAGGLASGCMFIGLGLVMEELEDFRIFRQEHIRILTHSLNELLSRAAPEKSEAAGQE